MREWENAALKRKKELQLLREKSTDLDTIIEKTANLKMDDLAKLLPNEVIEIFKKYEKKN